MVWPNRVKAEREMVSMAGRPVWKTACGPVIRRGLSPCGWGGRTQEHTHAVLAEAYT